MTDTFGETIAIAIITVVVAMLLIGYSNCDADSRCESLKAQGVAAVLTQGCITRECVVLERVVTGQERAK